MSSLIPDTPLLISGGLGGPAVMYLVTPFRNGLTLAANDQKSGIRQIYRQVFANSLARGWTGGAYPAIAACPQFLCLGPAYHVFYNNGFGVFGAVTASSILETGIVYGAESKNAQLATNQKAGRAVIAQPQRAYVPFGPGVFLHASRNIIATSGIRIFNAPVTNSLNAINEKYNAGLSKGAIAFAGDFGANVISSALSMPIHMAYNFTVTTPEIWKMGPKEKMGALSSYLVKQYMKDGRISPLVLRDLGLRIMYLANAYTLYVTIERSLVSYWAGDKQ
eukprot:GEMP01015333.1.p1 GENE.GEMP01015333.1~~GEMP01015333.1.p1  ORF type:complete len:278 (+),score=47.14 GEMP01015333.1:51-884(+)